jgi:hypothetical protein
MSLALLVATPAVCAYYDAAADVLFVDMHGHLTWRQAQVVRGRVGQVARSRPYPRVLLRTQPPRGLTPYPRLGHLLGAGLQQLGARHLAWVCQPAPASLAATAGGLLDRSLVVNQFNDVEQAATWLGKYRDHASLFGVPRSAGGARYPRSIRRQSDALLCPARARE